MATLDFSPIQAFVASHRKDLRRIARATQGEHDPDDVATEAIMLWTEFVEQDESLDLTSPDGEKKLLSYLYQRLVPWADTKVRYAVRLDHDEHGDDPETDVHPLLGKLKADDGADPLSRLVEREDAAEQALDAPGPHTSLAAAYAQIIHDLDNRMVLVAQHLLISLSWCYRRVGRARVLAEKQQPLPEKAVRAGQDTELGSWRAFKLRRRRRKPDPLQLELNFGEWGLFGAR